MCGTRAVASDVRPLTSNVFLRRRFSVPLPNGRRLDLGLRTLVMGVLNVTPDSFADGGAHLEPGRAVAAAEAMIAAGADVIDVGGESTRPGAPPVDADEEWRRIGPVIDQLRRRTDIPISVDTYKAAVARRAIDGGVDLVNDISAFAYDPDIAPVVARSSVAVVLMHMRGRSADMYAHAEYADVTGEVVAELSLRIRAAEDSGVSAERIIVDPGLGFAKRASHSFAALAGLPRLAQLGRPILSGPSRKSFLNAAAGDRPAAERVWGTAGAVAASVMLGAHMVRVHDVAEMVQVVRVVDAILSAGARQEGRGQRADGKGQRAKGRGLGRG
jgi:dihydropteroate synthase